MPLEDRSCRLQKENRKKLFGKRYEARTLSADDPARGRRCDRFQKGWSNDPYNTTNEKTKKLADRHAFHQTPPPPFPHCVLGCYCHTTPQPTPKITPDSVLISVYIYGHHIAWYQWIGVFSVYGGLALNVWTRYNNDGERRKIRADELKLDTLTEASAISLRPAGKRSPGQRGWGQPFRGGEGGVGASAASLAAPQNDKEEEALLLGDTPVVVGKNGRMTR